LKSIPHL